MLLLSLLSPAHAFCGAYVGGLGEELTNYASRVVLARSGNTTTLTVAADVRTSAADFGLLLPVPTVLQAEDVAVVDPALLTALDEYSVPRAVAYTCEDVYRSETSGGGSPSFGCYATDDSAVLEAKDSSGGYYGEGGPPADNSVQVESSFAVANYEISVLSAENAADLYEWLDYYGYAVPAGGEEILQEYIDGGSYFLAAKVGIEDEGVEINWLPPLQFTYTSEVFGLPIRIGTISADGTQDVLIFTITPDSEVGISNYPRLTIEDECMFPADDLAEFYANEVETASAQGAGWFLEHSWSLNQSCDPCTATDSFTVQQMKDLGYEEADTGHSYWNLGYLTRIRMRYRPEEATQDLVLYETGTGVADQTRYIQYVPELEFLFPVCGEGMVENPGTCEADGVEVTSCAVAPSRAASPGLFAAGALTLVGAIGALRRKKG